MNILEKFGKAIRERRLELELSQEDLAERTSLHRTYIGGIERGERNVSLLNIFELSVALEISPDLLFESLNKEWARERRNRK